MRCTRRAGGNPLTSASTRAIARPRAITLAGSAPPPMPKDSVTGNTAAAAASPSDGGHHAKQYRFHQDQRRHLSVRESNGFQHGQFRYALAHGLHHGIAGQEQQREEHGADDRVHHDADVADLPELRLRILRLVLGERLIGRVREQGVDGRAHRRGPIGIVDAHDECEHAALVELPRFVEVRVVDEDAIGLRLRARDTVGTDDIEAPVGAAILLDDRRGERDAIAHLPSVRFHQHIAHERAGARRSQCAELVRRRAPFGIDVEHRFRVGGIDEHVVAPALVDAGKRPDLGRAADSRQPLDSLQVGDGQRLDLADAAHDDEPVGVRVRNQAAEPGVDSLQQSEKQEGDGDRQHREYGSHRLAPQAGPDQLEVRHAAARAPASINCPLSRWSCRVARSAAFGS